jgi:hypothetical protein
MNIWLVIGFLLTIGGIFYYMDYYLTSTIWFVLAISCATVLYYTRIYNRSEEKVR